MEGRRNVGAGNIFEIAGAAIVEYEEVENVDRKSDEVDEDELLELGQFLGKGTYADVKLSEDLTPTQGQEVQKLLHECPAIFSEVSGATILI